MKNIVLIGMPGSGKSTVGVLLAKALGYSFVDVDLIICKEAGKPLQKILDNEGLDFFLHLEGKIGAELDCDKTVIATGGSMVLSENAMETSEKTARSFSLMLTSMKSSAELQISKQEALHSARVKLLMMCTECVIRSIKSMPISRCQWS